jgi:3-hydroxyacyl-[acyl-carrier-protein] dehydratase
MKFRMVDRILSWEARRRISGIKTVSFEEYSLKTPLGDAPGLPPTLQMESLFQLGNWLIMLSSDFTLMGLLVRTQEVRFETPLNPGEHMRLELRVRRYRDDGVLFDGSAVSDSGLIGAGRGCLAMLVPLAEYYDPDDVRVLYSEIYRPGAASTGEG